MTTRERFHAVMSFSKPERLPLVEWATYWDKTVARWHTEGLSPNVTTPEAIRDAVGLDDWRQLWAPPFKESCPKPASHGAGILSSAAEYTSILPHLYPDPVHACRAAQPWADAHEAGAAVIWITVEGFFWFPRRLLGIENHLYAFYDEPELMHRINRDILEWNIALIDTMCSITTPDFATIAEDMSYNHGPMLSHDLFSEFLAPYYRELIEVMNARGIIPFVDSDGDVTELIPWLKDVGVQGILPLERMAGVDVSRIRKDHPDFLMIGAYDKMVMSKGSDAMRAEFERLLPTMRGGGFIPSVDHQTPPDVSWDQYLVFVEMLREYSERAGE